MIGTQEDSHELLNILLGGIFDEIQTFIVSYLKNFHFSYHKAITNLNFKKSLASYVIES